MMEEAKLKNLLNELAEKVPEPVRPGLAEDIKGRIPDRLRAHRGGLDTVNIIIDLRISKLAAAAIIIVTTILCVQLLDGRHSTGEGIYEDGKLLMKYCLGGAGAGRSEVLAGISRFCEYLVHEGKDAEYYGDSVDPEDTGAVLMHWRLGDGDYRVIFNDLRVRTISAEELIKLQTEMLQKKAK